MKGDKLFICVILSFWSIISTTSQAQSGDQILDGIGETALIARYVFDRDLKDWSRNNHHGNIRSSKLEFVNDDLFGKVLSLSADNETFISIPGDALMGEESISVLGWVFIRSTELDQTLFDFGKSSNAHFSVAAIGAKDNKKLRVEIGSGAEKKYRTISSAITTNKWHHFAVVMDVSSRTLSTYINGKCVGEAKNVELELSDVFDSKLAKRNLFFIGKSLDSQNSSLNAKLHDFRIYRIPLKEKEIITICKNALGDEPVVNETQKKIDDLPKFEKSIPQLYDTFLINVPDIYVQTTVGFLPRLPRYLEGVYNNGIKGQKARVIWPAPTDNSSVLKSGTYIITGSVAGTDLRPKAFVTVNEEMVPLVPERKLEVFQLDEVSLDLDLHGNKTKFIENRDKFINELAKTNPNSFLYMFRNAYGEEQPDDAIPLGVWDSQETKLRGHASGHYLTAIAQAYASTGYNKKLQDNFANKMEIMINTLYKLSQMSGKPMKEGEEYVSDPTAVPIGHGKLEYDSDLSEKGIRGDYWNWGVGYISAYPPDQFIMLENGATYGGQPNQVWAPYYTLHKILAGLLDVYEITGNDKALEIAKGMGNWVNARLTKLPAKTLISMWNRYIAGEYGGMNEVMSRLYIITKEKRYFETAQLFDNIKMFFGDINHSDGLAKNVDTFRGLHANQHIPQIVGALETYHASDASEYYHVADNFWFKIVNDYMYSIGGVAGARNPANAECFTSQPATLYENGFSSSGQNETCATYNMLKLTSHLFLYDQRGEFMDYYERGLYNDILASVAEDSPANTYHIPLRPGSVKHFGNADMSGFTCCNGTAIESSTKLQNSIYFKSKDNNVLYVNLFVPSTVNWTERNVVIEQKTAYPKEDQTQLRIIGKGKFDIKVRVPHWATDGFYVKINGKTKKVKAEPGSYITLSREWKNGDTIDLKMPFQFYLNPIMDQQNIASLFYGPVLLAAQEQEPRIDWRKVTFDSKNIGKSIESNSGELEFTIDGVVFKPFYNTYGRHSVYLDVSLK